MIIRNRMYKQHTQRQSLLAFNQLSRRRLTQMDVEPGSTRTRAGQVITSTHQRLIDIVIDSLQEDDYIGLPKLETDDDDQEIVNVIPQFEMQDDSMIEFMHNINIMTYTMKSSRLTSEPVRLYPYATLCVVQSSQPYRNWSRGLYQTMALQKHLICTKQMTFGCSTG